MSDDRIEPTIKTIDLDSDTDSNDKSLLSDSSLGQFDKLKKFGKSDKSDKSDKKSDTNKEAESELEADLEMIGKELKKNQDTAAIIDDDKTASADDDDELKISGSKYSQESNKKQTSKDDTEKQKSQSILERAADQFDADDSTETEKNNEKNQDKPATGKDKNKVKERHKEKESSPENDLAKSFSPFEFISSQHASFRKHAVNTSSWFSLRGRIDRLRAAIMLLMISYLSIAIIAFSDPFLKSIAGIFNSEVNSPKQFLFNPVIYIAAGIGLWLLSLLIIAMKRLRDADLNPLLGLLLYIPPLSIVTLYYCTLPSSPDDNKYGAKPASHSVLTWVGFAIFVILIPLIIINYADSFTKYFWDLQINLDVKPEKALE